MHVTHHTAVRYIGELTWNEQLEEARLSGRRAPVYGRTEEASRKVSSREEYHFTTEVAEGHSPEFHTNMTPGLHQEHNLTLIIKFDC